ncbi:hypothetical protein KEF85_15460 [Methylomonas paludis]|uniref:Uncharacterized protein n=1 Tax=Methylomonas paludis TaxID=1173101 RepID=A0A975R945_9GAMM|nr:hypothetical protein [Methylomonas paludis]QWF70697.1 hypothetical protein KEF85_15460 [Methylomonas paludis]
MVAIFRQFLTILLVLLQYAAPLVHAHSGGISQQHGLHLYEFESLHFSPAHATLEKSGYDQNLGHCVFNIGSAIRQQPILHDTLSPDIGLFSGKSVFPAIYHRHVPSRLPALNHSIAQPFLYQNIARGPPQRRV